MKRLHFLLVALVLFGACGRPAQQLAPADGKLRVVTTVGMISDIAQRIAGEHAEVMALMGPGIDPHLYKASEGDVRRLEEADLILYNGLNLEGKMGDIFVKMSRKRPVIAVTESIPQHLLREPPELDGHYDPHVWFDVSLWIRTIEPIENALAELRPQHAAHFRANAERLRAELNDLDSWVMTSIATIPKNRRVLITAHDAFGYYGLRYGLEVRGLQGISTLSEAGLQDVERLVDFIVERQIKAIFVESSVPKKSIESLQAACRAKGHEVVIGGELFSDAMGPAGTPEGTYSGMIRANTEKITNALR